MKRITFFMDALVLTIVAWAGPIVGMSGTYKVGTTETSPNYASLSAAVADLNTLGVAGNVVLEITSDITEAANIGLGVNTNGFSITIRPDADANRTITFTQTTDNSAASGHFVIGQKNLTTSWTTPAVNDINTITTSNVTIDGYASGFTTRRLKFTTSNVSISSSRLIVVVAACQNTVVKNCIIESKSTGGSAMCIAAIARKGASIDNAPVNLTIENNVMTSVSSLSGMGFNSVNSGTPGAANKITGLAIKNNTITACGRLIYLLYIDGAEISGNELKLTQLLTPPASVNYGIWTSTQTIGTFNIFNNKFTEISTIDTAPATAGGLRGLSLAAAPATFSATYNIYNNTFAGMDRKGNNTLAVNLTYIFFGGNVGNIYNNTFYMPALTKPATLGYYQAITLSSANPVIKNNIFISNEDAMVNAFYGTITTGASDYNIFYNKAGNTKSLIVSATTYSTLALYQAANLTKDVNSKSGDVSFTNAATGDLSLIAPSLGDVNLRVPRLASVTTDKAGTARKTYTYAGAYDAGDLNPTKVFTVTVPNGTAKVYVAGSFLDKAWDNTNPLELTATANPNEFSAALPCEDAVEYKYLCEKGDWDYQEAIYQGGGDPISLVTNRTYNAADVVPIWYRVNKISLNASFATNVPNTLFVKGSFNSWASGIEMTKSGSKFSTVLGGNVGDKYPANTQYKYYTNDEVNDNWECNVGGGAKDNRWAIAPVMNDEIARFTTETTTGTSKTIEQLVRIMRTSSGVQAIFDGEANIELYTINGVLIEKTKTSGSYSRDLNSGIYIIRVNGKATKFIK
jgi:hypothetical protein